MVEAAAAGEFMGRAYDKLKVALTEAQAEQQAEAVRGRRSEPDTGRNTGGIWLSGAIVVSTMMAGIGLYVTEMFEDSFQIQGMAEVDRTCICTPCLF